MVMTTSPSLSKETARFVSLNRNSASTCGTFVRGSIRKPEQSSRNHVLPQVRGRSTNQPDEYGRNYLSEDSGSANRVKQEFHSSRHSFDGTDTRESIRGATAPAPASALVDLVGQMNARKGGRFSPNILESYAETIPLTASCHTVQKRCMYPDCTKISVSRGLCRGHGGGRRCHFLGCAKSAQSRSNFCWAHGGGQRCDVPNCMRSRKTKRFCVAHIQFENLVACEQNKQPRTDTNGASPVPKSKIIGEACIEETCQRLAGATDPTKRAFPRGSMNSGEGGRRRSHARQQDPLQSCKQQAPAMQRRYLPSLGQALSSASRSPPNIFHKNISRLLG